MKTLLVTIIYCQIAVLGFMGGYTYIVHQQLLKSDQCFKEILKEDITIRDYYGHSIDINNTWIHAQAAVSNHYLACMGRRERE